MFKSRTPLIILLSLFISSLFSAPLLAAEFNPHTIISDQELQDWQSLGRSEIQTFLNTKNSPLATMSLPDLTGVTQPVSEIIYQAAETYRINPKYLLVKLQKEQSLVSDKTPSQRQLDWATGYGVCDSCDTTDPKLTKYKGFAAQIDGAAGIMRWYYENFNVQTWIKRADQTYSIDGQSVTPTSNATAFLYTYTPHIQGNQNFWKLWQNWFQATYPDGTLIKGSTPTVYVLLDGKKRPFKSMTALVTRYNAKLIVTVPDSELARYTTGPEIAFPNYSILRANNQYYLLDNDRVRPFASADLMRTFGYNPDEVIDVSSTDIAGYTIGATLTTESLYPTGRLVRVKENKTLYYIKDGLYYVVPEQAIADVRFPGMKATPAVAKDLEKLESGGLIGFPDGTVIGNKSTGQYFVMEKGKRRGFASETAFKALGYNTKNTIWLTQQAIDQYPRGEAIYSPLPDTAFSSSTLDAAPGDVQLKPASIKAAPAKKVVVVTPVEQPIITKENRLFMAPRTDAKPTTFPETGKMIAVPATATITTGPVFNTRIDTYLIARYQPGTPITVLAGKNIDAPRPLASMTKVMTAYRLQQEGLNPDAITTYDPKAHSTPYGYLFKIAPGEQVYNRDLWYTFLTSSLNTAGRMLVKSTVNDEAGFISRMNVQAKTWGLTRTYFHDVHGYDLYNQGTARDYATLFQTAAQDPFIFQALATQTYTYTELRDMDKVPEHNKKNSNELTWRTDLPYKIVAGKTGYLYESGYNITMVVERADGEQFLIVAMGNPDYTNRNTETDRLVRWVLATF